MDDRHHSYDDSQILEIKDNLIGLTGCYGNLQAQMDSLDMHKGDKVFL